MSNIQGYYLGKLISAICNSLLFLCFVNIFMPNSNVSVSGDRTVMFTKPTSFSNYYAKLNKKSHSDPYFGYGQLSQTPTPVSVPENVIDEYFYAPQQQYGKPTLKNPRMETTEMESEQSLGWGWQAKHPEKGNEQSLGWGWPSKTKEKEVDTTLDDLTGVMGPAFFLIPFVAKLIPFAIPAIPLSHILNNYAPASIEELVTRFQEIATQITEFFQQASEAAQAAAGGEG